jgi:hypothetical protein
MVRTERSILAIVPVPIGTRVVTREPDGSPHALPVLSMALCAVREVDTETGEATDQGRHICGVFAGEGLELCEDTLGGQLMFYLGPGEELPADVASRRPK